jgi:SNF2 family DNA or RNA helicase
LLVERIQQLVEQGKQAIVWARYTTEILDVSRALDELGIPSAKYHGETKRGERLDIIDDFQAGKLKVFIGNQRAGGTGITLTAASSVHYYSNSFSYRDRMQSEDRAMRIGQNKDVTYYNYAGIGTVDEYVISCLLNKQNVSFEIVDKGRDDLFNLGGELKTA